MVSVFFYIIYARELPQKPKLLISFSIVSTLIFLIFCAAGKTVITSDHALKLESVPDWIAIVGSGYIGLEFSDVYTALGSEVTC